jgi:DNA-binding MarR family transcriptional regulator
MAETKRMTAEQVVSCLLEEEGLDFLRESLTWVVQQLMEAEVSELVGAARGERAPEERLTHRNGYRAPTERRAAGSCLGRPANVKRTERIGQLLVVAADAAQALASERLEPLGLSPRAWGVLSTLVESGPLTQIELATATSIDRTAMTYLLDELEERGLLERRRNPGDRRSYLIHLTSQGRQTQRDAAGELAKQADFLLQPLAAAERKQLIDALTRIADHWERHAAPSASENRPRSARALQALQQLADATDR